MGEIHYAPVNTSVASFVAGFDGWVGDFEMVISDEIAGLAGADGEEEVPSGHCPTFSFLTISLAKLRCEEEKLRISRRFAVPLAILATLPLTLTVPEGMLPGRPVR